MKKPHEILQISEDATAAEAKAAFRKLARTHHPDKGGDPDAFAALNAAYRKFTKPAVCPLCEGTGEVRTRTGAAVKKSPCPKCFSTDDRE